MWVFTLFYMMIMLCVCYLLPGSLTDAYDELGNHYVIPVYCVCTPINLITNEEHSGHSTSSGEMVIDEASLGEEYMIRCRMSDTCKDHKLNVRPGEAIGVAKKRLVKELGKTSSKLKWFYGGKILYDKMTIADANVPRGYVIQVVVPCDDV